MVMRMMPGGRGLCQGRAGQGVCPGQGAGGGPGLTAVGVDGIGLQEAPAERVQHGGLMEVAQGHQVIGTQEAVGVAERRQLELDGVGQCLQ